MTKVSISFAGAAGRRGVLPVVLGALALAVPLWLTARWYVVWQSYDSFEERREAFLMGLPPFLLETEVLLLLAALGMAFGGWAASITAGFRRLLASLEVAVGVVLLLWLFLTGRF